MMVKLHVDDGCCTLAVAGGEDTCTLSVASDYVGGGGEHETYDGEYTSTPMWRRQVYLTDGKLMTDDFTVEKIREYEVANDAGGLTLTI